MVAIALTITQPQNGASFIGQAPVVMRGQIVDRPESLAEVPLYYRWYSSLFRSENDRYSLNALALNNPVTPYHAALSVGTHVITLAGSDRPTETSADFESITHGGVTGGEKGDSRCIIHVLHANIKSPVQNATLSRSNSTLEADAPLHWTKDEYQSLNQIQYRWVFQPLGQPTGRRSATLSSNFTFDANVSPPVLRYQGALPRQLGTGRYRLSLRVELKTTPQTYDEQSLTITLS